MSMGKRRVGKAVQWVGGFSVAHTTLTYGYALRDVFSDASIRTDALLVAFEGFVFLCAGLAVIWLGDRIAKTSGPLKCE